MNLRKGQEVVADDVSMASTVPFDFKKFNKEIKVKGKNI
jgi:hypothetical protein